METTQYRELESKRTQIKNALAGCSVKISPIFSQFVSLNDLKSKLANAIHDKEKNASYYYSVQETDGFDLIGVWDCEFCGICEERGALEGLVNKEAKIVSGFFTLGIFTLINENSRCDICNHKNSSHTNHAHKKWKYKTVQKINYSMKIAFETANATENQLLQSKSVLIHQISGKERDILDLCSNIIKLKKDMDAIAFVPVNLVKEMQNWILQEKQRYRFKSTDDGFWDFLQKIQKTLAFNHS